MKKHHWHVFWHEKLFEKHPQPHCQTRSKTRTNTSRLLSPKLNILQESSLNPQFPSTKNKIISLYCFFLFWSIIPKWSINPLIIHLMVVQSTYLSNKNETSISSENPSVFYPRFKRSLVLFEIRSKTHIFSTK